MQTTGPLFRIEKSTCGNFIRVHLGGKTEVLSMSTWSKAIGHSGEFRHNPELKPVEPTTPNEPDCA